MATREKKQEYNRTYRERHGERLREEHRLRYNEDLEFRAAVLQKQQAYNAQNREAVNERQRARNAAHPEKNSETCRRWRKNNPEKPRGYSKRPGNRLRARLYSALRAQGIRKRQCSAIRDLGCTIPEFRSYMAGLFREGMTWQNHGRWHIDHVVPLSSFDLSDPEQVRRACHYTNLQPLWASENLSKRAKMPTEN